MATTTTGPDLLEVTRWLKFVPTYKGGNVMKVDLQTMYRTKPDQPDGGGIIVEVVFKIPRRVFQPFGARLEVEIPETAVTDSPSVAFQGLKDLHKELGS